MSHTDEIEYKTRSGSGKDNIHECPDVHIYWRSYDDPDYPNTSSSVLHSVKMDANAKNWGIPEKKAFVQRLIDKHMIDPVYAKRTFEIYIDDCKGDKNTWYTVNAGVMTKIGRSLASVVRMGGKSQKRRAIRRRRSTSRRNKRKTRRFRK